MRKLGPQVCANWVLLREGVTSLATLIFINASCALEDMHKLAVSFSGSAALAATLFSPTVK